MNKINFRKWLHFIITRDEKHQNLSERVSLTYKKRELFRSPPFKDEKLVGTNRQNSAVNGAIIVSVLWLPREFIFSTCPRFNVSYLCQLSLDVLVNRDTSNAFSAEHFRRAEHWMILFIIPRPSSLCKPLDIIRSETLLSL
jgi:hypothetical protein